MSEVVKIEGSLRNVTGKGYARKLRQKGLVPGVILSEKGKSTSIELDPKWLGKAYKNGKKFVLVLEGQEKDVHIKELQINPVKRSVLHVDLMYA